MEAGSYCILTQLFSHFFPRLPAIQLLNEQRFSEIEKIKTIGSTYMAASGLSPDRDPSNPDIWSHLCSLAEFALAMKETIEKINIHSFNNFRLRIGEWGK